MYRKISHYIEEYLTKDANYILCIDGARQIGKTYIIRELGQRLYPNYVEINMADDKAGDRLFERANTLASFYLCLSSFAGGKIKGGNKRDTLIFIDEIQVYPELFTLLKSLNLDGRYKFICSGSALGIAMRKCTLTPMGSIIEKKMYAMDFEEFLLANGVGEEAISYLKGCFEKGEEVECGIHERILHLFKLYLLIGGMPAAVAEYLRSQNILMVREIQRQIIDMYGDDTGKYDRENRLKIKRIYGLVPSNLENKVKRIRYNDIEKDTSKNRYLNYEDELDYLISSGIVLNCKAISEPKFPLLQSSSKNLIKLYMNDVGLLTCLLYKESIQAVLGDKAKVNLGAVYETVASQELSAHGHELFYYDRKNIGEVDFLVDDYSSLSVLPIEIKSGKDVRNFKALPKMIDDKNYGIEKALVLSNERALPRKGKILFAPIYNLMFI